MNSLADRFRTWYEYERDCNAKAFDMIESVPKLARVSPIYQRAVDKFAHMIAARRMWLFRLGHLAEAPGLFPAATPLADLKPLLADTESAWVAYLKRLDDAELARDFEYSARDGRRYRWTIEGVLTQLFGHAWYHRGQVAQLVATLGGTAVDTDYIFWAGLKPLDA